MLHLQSPIKPKSYQADRGIIQLTQLFGGHDMDYSELGLAGHNGLDFKTKQIQDGLAPVVAAHDGTVVSDRETQSDTAGRFVKILSDVMDLDGKKCKILTVYFHLSVCKHALGARVKAGAKIGVAGNTGSFTLGAHLHFGLYILSEHLNWQSETNDYDGATDPLPYLTDNNIYQYGDSLYARKFYYNGQPITREQVDELIPEQFRG